MVGQRFIERLYNHPYFNIAGLAASDRNSGKSYGEAANWLLDSDMPPEIAEMELKPLSQLAESQNKVVFSALPSDTAVAAETELAAAGKAVFTNASPHRMDQNVPLLLPEVNPDHLALIHNQETPGYIVANANCSSIILSLALAPIARRFGLVQVHVFTEQALSGAGYPGVSALDVVDNVVPYIKDEEDKLETEPIKILGSTDQHAEFTLIATTTRVNVREGHLIVAHATLKKDVQLNELCKAWREFRGSSEVSALPSSPLEPIHVFDEPDRPQPRRDRDIEQGMSISVGRIRLVPGSEAKVVQFIALGHNTVRGAAGQSILNAELAYSRNLLSK